MRFSIHYIQNYCYLFQEYSELLSLIYDHSALSREFILKFYCLKRGKQNTNYWIIYNTRPINIYIIVLLIFLFRMKRFSRKNSQNKSQDQLSQQRVRTQIDDHDLSSSQHTARNMSFDSVSIVRNMAEANSAVSLIFTLLKNKLYSNLQHSVYKLKNNTKLARIRDRSVGRIICIASKRLYKYKLDSFNKINQQKRREFIKLKAVNILNTCSAGVVRKLMMEGFFGVVQFSKAGLVRENSKLKQIQAKYREISIPEEYCLAFRKFLKIGPKNTKPFLKITQQTIQPSLTSLSALLQQKRINKHIPSQSEILISSIKNYVLIYKELIDKLGKSQKQNGEINNERAQILSELEFLRKYQNSCKKQFQKYDQDVLNKLNSLLEQNFSQSSLKNLQKVLQQQLKVCLTKGQNGFEYASRATILKVATILTNNKRSQSSTSPLKPSSSNKSLTKSQTIQQQSSIEQSDILEYVTKIVEELIQEMKNSGNTIQSLKGCQCQQRFISDFKVKNMLVPQLGRIHEKLQHIKAIYCQKAFNCYQLEQENKQLKNILQSKLENEKSINQNNLKNPELTELNNKIAYLQQKIKSLQLKHESEIQIIYLEEEQSQRQLQATIKQIEAKLQQSLEQISIKDAKIEELNNKFTEKNNKYNQMSDEYRRFRKTMKGLDRSMQERNRSVNEILQRSLSKSKASVSSRPPTQTKKPKLPILLNTPISYKSPEKTNKKSDQSLANILYNIMIKYKDLPDTSQSATELWSRLNAICELNGFQLEEKLEEYVVNWMKENSKIGVKEPKKIEMPQNGRKTPPKQRIYRDLKLRTAKNNKRESFKE